MRHRRDPHRQCIGCRKVQPKKELLRLVLQPAGKIVFDQKQKMEGRGVYLCPEQRCFTLAYKNSRWRKHFLNKEGLLDVFHGICETMNNSIEYYFALGKKMNCLKNSNQEDNTLLPEDIVVVNSEISKEQKIEMYTAAQEKRTVIFTIPGKCMKDAASVTVKHRFPLILHVKRDLRIYERLSSKGLVL